MKKILVPTDFSKAAQFAVAAAADIARKAEARLILMHVIEQPGSESFRVTGEMTASQNWEEKLYTLKLIEKRDRNTLPRALSRA